MKLKASNTKPDFVTLSIKDIHSTKGFLPSKVYNIYECQFCIIEREKDVLTNKLSDTERLCKHGTHLLIKYKQCPCGTHWWGSILKSTKTCTVCNPYISVYKKRPKKYYRLKLFCFKSYTDLNDPEKWDCHNRSYCLESMFKNGFNKGLACKECPFYIGNSV